MVLDPVTDSGVSNTDHITKFSVILIQGNVSEGVSAIWATSDIDGAMPVTTANSQGAWMLTTSVLSEGFHTFTAFPTDVAGNQGGVFSGITVTIDLTPPDITSLSLNAASDSGVSNSDRITKLTTLTIDGQVDEGMSWVSVSDVLAGGEIAMTTADTGGAWTITTPTLVEGVHNIIANATDIAGNLGSASTPLVVTIVTTPPTCVSTAPAFATADDSGMSNNDGITNATMPTIVGTTTPGSCKLQILADGNNVGTVTSDATGVWSAVGLTAEGQYQIAVVAIDDAGNQGTPVVSTLVIDRTAPTITSFVLDPAYDSGPPGFNNDSYTNMTNVQVMGTTDEGDSMIWLQEGAWMNSTMADAQGDWSEPIPTLAEGMHQVVALAIDVAGNMGPASNLVITIDLTAPTVTMLALRATDDTGASNSDNITRLSDLQIIGTTNEAPCAVLVFNSSNALLGTPIALNGSWAYDATGLSQGSHTFVTFAMDKAGNLGPASAGLTIFVDLTAPSVQNCPSNVLNSTTTATGKAYWAVPSATDNHDTTVAVPPATIPTSNNPVAPGSSFSIGITTVTYQFVDVAGNLATPCQFNVNITNSTSGPPRVDCVGSYGSYHGCNATCTASGVEVADFTITTQPSGNGQPCPASTKSRTCTSGSSTCGNVDTKVAKIHVTLTFSGSPPTDEATFKAELRSDIANALNISQQRVVNLDVTPVQGGSGGFTVQVDVLDKSATPASTDSRSIQNLKQDLDSQATTSGSELRSSPTSGQMDPNGYSSAIILPPKNKSVDCPSDILSFNFSECYWIYIVIIGGIILVLVLIGIAIYFKCRGRKKHTEVLWGLDQQNREKQQNEEYEIDFAAGEPHSPEHAEPALPEIELGPTHNEKLDDDENFVIE
jgi:hypothetical protein